MLFIGAIAGVLLLAGVIYEILRAPVAEEVEGRGLVVTGPSILEEWRAKLRGAK